MRQRELQKLERKLEQWFEYLFSGMGRRERLEALYSYIQGLLLDGERKSIAPIAERMSGDQTQTEACRQRIQQAVCVAKWNGETVYQRIAQRADEVLDGEVAWVLDDTGFPKKGFKSVGVQRQYSGTMGRIDNCQIATSLHCASEKIGVCIGMQLYLPKDWALDPKRRGKAGIPDDVVFEEKWKTALSLIDRARSWGATERVVLADAGYGDCGPFRAALAGRGLQYVVGIGGSAVVWPPGTKLSSPTDSSTKGRGRPRIRWQAPKGVEPVALREVAEKLPSKQYRKVTWRVGSRGPQSGKFAAVRIQTARHDEPIADMQWLLCEWPKGQEKPTTFYLSNLPAGTPLKMLVRVAKLRWRIERDYQEMKSELGLDHFEGRTWNGFHHHTACVAAAHAFLALHRELFSPQQE